MEKFNLKGKAVMKLAKLNPPHYLMFAIIAMIVWNLSSISSSIEREKNESAAFLSLSLGIEKRMQDILLYAIGNVNEN